MKSFYSFVIGLIVATSFFAQIPMRGVYVSDIDTSADACNDFFEYANGAWRKANPIPASMPRWSRRWQAGEKAKDRLREILVEVSAKQNYPKGSAEQLVGDFFSTCNNQALADKLGVTVLEPLLRTIRAAKNKQDVLRSIATLEKHGIWTPFIFVGGQDNHAPENVIAQIYAGGLSLPDRDYYLKTEERFVDFREK